VTVQKLSVSFAPELAELTVRRRTPRRNRWRRGWPKPRHRLKLDAIRAALEAFEAGHGPITDEKRARAKAQWPD
jgi:hypothetical protein